MNYRGNENLVQHLSKNRLENDVTPAAHEESKKRSSEGRQSAQACRRLAERWRLARNGARMPCARIVANSIRIASFQRVKHDAARSDASRPAFHFDFGRSHGYRSRHAGDC